MTFDYVTVRSDPLYKQLEEAAEECLDNIDGGEECRGRDAMWTRFHDLFAHAAAQCKAIAADQGAQIRKDKP